jgi:hypothetical protein
MGSESLNIDDSDCVFLGIYDFDVCGRLGVVTGVAERINTVLRDPRQVPRSPRVSGSGVFHVWKPFDRDKIRVQRSAHARCALGTRGS